MGFVIPFLLRWGIALLLAAPAVATAHLTSPHASKPQVSHSPEQHPWGHAGEPRRTRQVVRVRMADTLRFTPDRIKVRRGQTVTFEVHNAGRAMHEFVIGTDAALSEHAAMMRKHPDMEHDAPYMAHVPPGRTQRIHWVFTEAGTYLAGCLLPGHWEGGMKATIVVTP